MLLTVSAGIKAVAHKIWSFKAAALLRRDIMAAAVKNLEDMRLGEEKLTEHVWDLSSMRHASSATCDRPGSPSAASDLLSKWQSPKVQQTCSSVEFMPWPFAALHAAATQAHRRHRQCQWAGLFCEHGHAYVPHERWCAPLAAHLSFLGMERDNCLAVHVLATIKLVCGLLSAGLHSQDEGASLLKEDDSLLRHTFFSIMRHHHPEIAAKV